VGHGGTSARFFPKYLLIAPGVARLQRSLLQHSLCWALLAPAEVDKVDAKPAEQLHWYGHKREKTDQPQRRSGAGTQLKRRSKLNTHLLFGEWDYAAVLKDIDLDHFHHCKSVVSQGHHGRTASIPIS
jgi:hypothetical protein